MNVVIDIPKISYRQIKTGFDVDYVFLKELVMNSTPLSKDNEPIDEKHDENE